MGEIMLVWYVGLFIFAINGIQLVALRHERAVSRARDERLYRLLMRGKR